MKSNFFKYALSTLSISAILFGFADADSDYSVSSNHEGKIITPAASPVIQHGFDVFLTADFIYWTGRLDNLPNTQSQAIHESDVGSISDASAQSTLTVDFKHKMSPGFKAGIGLDLKHDGWDTYAKYTYFHTSATSNVSFQENGASAIDYSPRVVFDETTTFVESEQSTWTLHFNSVDWELGRNHYISPNLLLRPHMGFKGSWQNQSYNDYQNGLTDIQSDPNTPKVYNQITVGNYSSLNKQNYWGVGIRTGLNTSWQFNKNWSLFSDTALSALWGQFKITRVDTSSQDGADSSNKITIKKDNVIVTNMNKRIHTLRPVLELDLGIRWDYWFLDDDYRIRIQAAWEEQVWFDQNLFIRIGQPNRYGCLNMQGLTVDFRLDF